MPAIETTFEAEKTQEVVTQTGLDLITALNENGRASMRELAGEMGVALGTVSSHLKQLESSGVIRGYLPDVDPEKVGLRISVIIHVRMAKGKFMEVQDSISKHPRVYGIYDITGEWDSLVLARFADREELDQFIKTTLSQKYIERTNTSVVLNTVKQEPRVII